LRARSEPAVALRKSSPNFDRTGVPSAIYRELRLLAHGSHGPSAGPVTLGRPTERAGYFAPDFAPKELLRINGVHSRAFQYPDRDTPHQSRTSQGQSRALARPKNDCYRPFARPAFRAVVEECTFPTWRAIRAVMMCLWGRVVSHTSVPYAPRPRSFCQMRAKDASFAFDPRLDKA
jgi:hypothetical protein